MTRGAETEAVPEEEKPPASSGGSLYRNAAICVVLYAVVVRFAILRATHSATEDFFITLRYAENISSGHGFVYNPGEHVLGTTTPLYTLLLALFHRLGLDPIFMGKAVNILADGATVFLIVQLLARTGRPRLGLFAALLYAAASTPINFSIGGMETGLVTLAGISAVYFYVERRPHAFCLSLALLFLLRIDGLLLAGFLLTGWLLPERRNLRSAVRELAAGSIPALILVLPWLLFATLYFGSPIPVSMLAKMAVYSRMFPQPLPNLPVVQLQFLGGAAQKLMFAAFLAGLAAVWKDSRLVVPVLWLLVYYGVMLVSKVIAFGWYFMPPLPVYYIVAALGAGQIIASVAPRAMAGYRLIPNAFLVAFFLLALPLTWHLRSITRDIAQAQRMEDSVRLPIGLWLRDNAKPNERILLEPIGYIGYYSRLPVLDMVGLVSPEVLSSYGQEVPNPLRSIVERFRPELLLLRPTEAKRLETDASATGLPLLGGEYALVRSFQSQDHQAVAFLLYRRR